MDLDFIFIALHSFAYCGWIALLLAPLNRTYCINFARLVALGLAVAYIAQFALNVEKVEGGSIWTLDGITVLFSSAKNVMFGWTHYLAFDLFIGSWEAEDAAAHGLPHWLLIPCLVLTLAVGPVGLLVYFIVRTVWLQAKKAPLPEAMPAS
jgi:hypothetical protein